MVREYTASSGRHPLVKICGITNIEDALAAVEAGADAVGLVYAASPRQLDVAEAREIVRNIPIKIATVGLFVNATADMVLEYAEVSGVRCLQLHGDESAAVIRQIAESFCVSQGIVGWPRVVKAFRLQCADDLRQLAGYEEADAFLVDTYVEGVAGGTGKVSDWKLAATAKVCGRPVILAGGLTPDNVSAAIAQVQPFGVDVSSGVESEPGKKDLAKLREFISQVRR